ncbi:hypothetical protein N8456_04320 [Porticoccaceae bacterium]|nr:hypothetical protein [Porticoccaceae bacterium]
MAPVIGAAVKGSAYTQSLEHARLLTLAAILWISYSAELISSDWLGWGVAYLIASGIVMWVGVNGNRGTVNKAAQNPG